MKVNLNRINKAFHFEAETHDKLIVDIDGNPSIKAIFHKAKKNFMPNGVLGFSDSDVSIEKAIKEMAKMPLHHEPGERYTYAIGIDVLGYLIEIVSGESLADFFQNEI